MTWSSCSGFLPAVLACLTLLPQSPAQEVLRNWKIDEVWSAHPSSPPILVSAGDSQYLAYYNHERRLTLAWRTLEADEWQRKTFPVVTRWATGAHALIGLAVDSAGIIHLVPYRRDLSEQPKAPPNMIYYRSSRPHDPESMAATHMIAPNEPNPSYPVFLTAPDGTLYFEFREGGSGQGNQRIHRQDPATRAWQSTPMLLDGRNRMSAYGGPRLGPDGRWHCHWMWRDTPSADTNHTLSYMVSPDLKSWQSACGTALDLPVHSDHPQVTVDPAKPGEGLLNPLQWIGYDRSQRPVLSYHRYAPCGNSAIYVARFQNGSWHRVAAHVWDFRWKFGGGGAIPTPLGAGAVHPAGEGRLALRVWSETGGSRLVLLDESTLQPLEGNASAQTPSETVRDAWKKPWNQPEVDFPARPMRVHWTSDKGKPARTDVRYLVRWETGPVNHGDRPVPQPWPPATPLRVFEIKTP